MKGPYSFSSDEKLKKTNQFRKVYKEGRSVKGSNFNLAVLPTELTRTRIGFSIGSNKINLATIRVRIKRLLREVYRQNKHLLKKGFDIVIIAKAGARDVDFYKTRDEILFLYNQAGILNKT